MVGRPTARDGSQSRQESTISSGAPRVGSDFREEPQHAFNMKLSSFNRTGGRYSHLMFLHRRGFRSNLVLNHRTDALVEIDLVGRDIAKGASRGTALNCERASSDSSLGLEFCPLATDRMSERSLDSARSPQDG